MARTFNGSSDYLRYAGAVVTAAPLTLACWLQRPTVANGSYIMGIYESAGTGTTNAFALRASVTDGGNYVLLAQTSAPGIGSNATLTVNVATWPEDAWKHVAGVYASATSRIAYIAGTAGTENTTSRTPASLDRTSIGFRDNASADLYYQGGVAEAGIWNVALTASEITALSAGVCPLLVRPTALVAYWPMMGRYSPEIDVKSRFDMTVNGTSTADHVRQYYASRPLQLGVPNAIVGTVCNRYFFEQHIARGSW